VEIAKRLLLALVGSSLWWLNPPHYAAITTPTSAHAEVQSEIARIIKQAGTTPDELERLSLLTELKPRTDLEASLRSDLEKRLPVVDHWANGKSRVVVDTSRAAENGYLCRFITGKVRTAAEGPVHPPELSAVHLSVRSGPSIVAAF